MDVTECAERWRDIPGCDGYQVSEFGRIRSRMSKKASLHGGWAILKLCRLPNGYVYFNPSVNRTKTVKYVHRAVLEAFVGPCPAGMEARHVVDNDRSNNKLQNLAWGTTQDNAEDRIRHGTVRRGERSPSAKLTENAVRAILAEAAGGAAISDLAARYGVRKENVSKIVNGHSWRHVNGARKPPLSNLDGHVCTKEASAMLGAPVHHIHSLVRSGALVPARCRKGLAFPVEAIQALADAARKAG